MRALGDAKRVRRDVEKIEQDDEECDATGSLVPGPPKLGCSKCRHALNGCGRCRAILTNYLGS